MQFETLQALWAMNGHGPFVWSAYAIALGTLAAVVWSPLARRRRFFREQSGIERRRAARAQAVDASALRSDSVEVS